MMPKSEPIVEVIIPFHRVDEYLDAAIKSVRASIGVQVRIIGVNDTGGRIDSTKLNFSKTDALIETSIRGYVNALKVGVQATSERYVGFLDSDDLIHPEKLAKQIAFLNQHNLDFVSCGLQKINSRNQLSNYGSLMGETPRTSNAKELWVIGSHGADSTLLCSGTVLREYWSNHQKFEPHFADYGWALSLPLNLQFGHLKDKFYFYRSHSAQISKSPPLGDSWQLIYPLWINNLLNAFPKFPRNQIPSMRESLAVAFPASMLGYNRREIKNLVKFEKALLSCLEGRSSDEIREWKRTMARRLLIASRGTSLKHWYVAPGLIMTALSLRLFGFSFRKINSEP